MTNETDTKQTTFTIRIDRQTYERLTFLTDKHLRSYGKQIKALVDKEYIEATSDETAIPQVAQ